MTIENGKKAYWSKVTWEETPKLDTIESKHNGFREIYIWYIFDYNIIFIFYMV